MSRISMLRGKECSRINKSSKDLWFRRNFHDISCKWFYLSSVRSISKNIIANCSLLVSLFNAARYSRSDYH